MDDQKYSQLTSNPLFVSRSIIEETVFILRGRCESVNTALQILLKSTPIVKPEKHSGDASTDYFDTTGLSQEFLEIICVQLLEAEAEAVPSSGKTTREVSRIASLVDLWHERKEVDVTLINTNSEQDPA